MIASPLVQTLLGRLLGAYMLLVGWTTRWRDVGREAAAPFWAGEAPVIVCLWHNRFLLIHATWALGRGRPPAYMLISQSREGGVVATAARTVGATDVVRGSAAKRGQQKGGFEALRLMLRILKEGGVMAMTPDGPRGPRMRAQMGPIQLAKLSGAAILPLTWSTAWGHAFQSWDRFLLPYPFGPGARLWGQPIRVARDADEAAMEAARLELEQSLNRLAAEADRMLGRPGVLPAEPAPDAAAQAASESAPA